MSFQTAEEHLGEWSMRSLQVGNSERGVARSSATAACNGSAARLVSGLVELLGGLIALLLSRPLTGTTHHSSVRLLGADCGRAVELIVPLVGLIAGCGPAVGLIESPLLGLLWNL
ncbi:hypothetical protein KFL_013610010 [Klebsormidium nitens]|uniref:Uncharacterized protein n=1 Tax=Klebsormidium nitens TaxID=105231 RepID=A0A1Y1IUC9_KLENI|nr:hypothetical protein KFL_013610010 [Klebsormidium nitens]|eukprot:GAQ93209.1 hypothetical protein KFL_013610010 [Klebsormidium nitens]